MIADANITDGKISTGIDAVKLADGTVTSAELQYINSLTSNAQTQIDAKTTDIAAINTLADGKVYLGNGSNQAAEVTLSGDVTINNVGVSAIGASKVVTAMIADANITDGKISTGIDAVKLADGTVTSAELQYINSLTSNAQAQIDAKTTDITAINTLADGKVYLGNGSNQAAEVTLSGDVTINNVGVSAIGANAVTYAKIQNVSAQNKILGRISSGAGVVEEISTTGSGNVVRATSPTLVNPTLGVATATSITTSEIISTGKVTNTDTGVITINAIAGRFKITATNTKQINNDKVNENSIIICTIALSTSTLVYIVDVVGDNGGFFTVRLNGSATVSINFLIIN